MKRFLIIMICAMVAVNMAFAQEAKKKTNVVKTKFLVESISCANCIKSIEKNLSYEKGVTDLKSDLETKTVEITYRSDKTTEDKLLATFKKMNRPAKVVKENE